MSVRKVLFAAALPVVGLLGMAGGAVAATPAPAWTGSSLAAPTNFVPGDAGHDYYYEVNFTNTGGAPSDGSALTLTDALPTGLGVKSVELFVRVNPFEYGDLGATACSTGTVGEASTVKCAVTESLAGGSEPARVEIDEHISLKVHVSVPETASGALVNEATIEGGGAPADSTRQENQASAVPAPGGFSEFDAQLLGADGLPAALSASHPFQMVTSFALNTRLAGDGKSLVGSAGNAKNIEVKLPPGMLGNPTTATRCTQAQFTELQAFIAHESSFFATHCPSSSAIGVISLHQLEGVSGPAGIGGGPIYNLVPPKGMPAQFGFSAGGPVYIDTELRSDGDYGVTAVLRNVSEAKRITAATVSIWGVPADPAHDPARGVCAEAGDIGAICESDMEPAPFLRLPSTCQSPMPFTMSFDSWADPGAFTSLTDEEGAPTGCEVPDFSPTVVAQPTTDVADSPSGLHFDLHFPQREHEVDPDGRSEADLRDATVTLPEGMLVNPSGATGRESCTPAQIGLLTSTGVTPAHFDKSEPGCPNASKIGTVAVETPLIDHPLQGAVYLARQLDNPFNSLLAIYITVDDPQSGIVVKLAGRVDPGPTDGRLTTTVQDNPQVPFEDFKLDFFGGDRAPLRTPPRCGTYTTAASLRPWSAPQGPEVAASDSFPIRSGPAGGCPSGALAPKLTAGLVHPQAGSSSPFVLRLSRDDGTGEFKAIDATTPPGLSARLRGVPYCPEPAIAQASARSNPGQGVVEQASPSCPAASQVGTVTAGAGAGPSPLYTGGKVYLAGPYKGAPLSLVAVIPAVAGPFDLGVVVDRIALHIDTGTAQVSALGDPFPTILFGIPLDVRDIVVNLDRSNFTVAPTNCEPMAVDATVTGTSGALASASQPFQVTGCSALGFKPKLRISLKGSTKHAGHPALKASLTYPRQGAYANVARAQVNLPHSEFIDQGNLNKTCTKPVLLAGNCPKTSIYGKAKAWTPLLDEPLEGPVYLVGGYGYKLPALVAELNGQIRVLLVGKVDSGPNHGIRNTFEVVPDAPVEKFVLEMKGGNKYSLLENSENLCRKPQRAIARFTAQNGRAINFRPLVQNDCRKHQTRHGKSHRQKRG